MRAYRSKGQSRSADAKPFSDVSPDPSRPQHSSHFEVSTRLQRSRCYLWWIPVTSKKRTGPKDRAPIPGDSQSPHPRLHSQHQAPRVPHGQSILGSQKSSGLSPASTFSYPLLGVRAQA